MHNFNTLKIFYDTDNFSDIKSSELFANLGLVLIDEGDEIASFTILQTEVKILPILETSFQRNNPRMRHSSEEFPFNESLIFFVLFCESSLFDDFERILDALPLNKLNFAIGSHAQYLDKLEISIFKMMDMLSSSLFVFAFILLFLHMLLILFITQNYYVNNDSTPIKKIESKEHRIYR